MRVSFLKDYGGVFESGDVVELNEVHAEMLIEAGYCKSAAKPKEKPKAKPKAKAKAK